MTTLAPRSTSSSVAAGAAVFHALEDQDYGSRDFSVKDPEGNIWSFGTYMGEHTN